MRVGVGGEAECGVEAFDAGAVVVGDEGGADAGFGEGAEPGGCFRAGIGLLIGGEGIVNVDEQRLDAAGVQIVGGDIGKAGKIGVGLEGHGVSFRGFFQFYIIT